MTDRFVALVNGREHPLDTTIRHLMDENPDLDEAHAFQILRGSITAEVARCTTLRHLQTLVGMRPRFAKRQARRVRMARKRRRGYA
jgi:hypothetical protein